MAQVIQRRAAERQDVVQHARMRVGHETLSHPVKVRNLSTQGMMGEGQVPLRSGTRLTVSLPQQGELAGTVVWVQEPRFGVAFDSAADPKFA